MIDPLKNPKSIYTCIKFSIVGDIKDTIFTQYGHLPIHEDSISISKQLTTFTTVASQQLSMLYFTDILNFNPIDFKFKI